ncbi:LuxR C-terminal-related transcriptional regulator [Frankia sp. Cpl3]|uniref:helix-turn-helix transcriptional regulator n=1 Tax=Parafrankia colletiae TaxID=573497 RepID=UPI000A5F5685|nr:LuxR family transcriptional regulator [Parafrankia colletiae]MCK9901917.1 LuxR C-terminal-related transcriptional regulator [Frankia sp. Cpl3]
MILVERDDVLRQLDLVLAQCSAGQGRVVLLDGPVGTGKTELVRYSGRVAARAGVTVRSATCARVEHVLPLGVVDQLLREAGPVGRDVAGAADSVTGFVSPDLVSAGLVPAGLVSAGLVPASPVSAGRVPAGVGPAGVVPASVVPTGVFPGGLLPDGSAPTGPVPVRTAPVGLAPGAPRGLGGPRGRDVPVRDGRPNAERRASLIAELLRAGSARAAVLGPGPDRELALVYQELTLLLLDLSERGPVLLSVDDVQHADVASLHFLLHLVRRIGSTRIAVLLAGDLASRPLDLAFRAELARAPEFRSLRVGPLSPAGSLRLVAAAQAGTAVPTRLVALPAPAGPVDEAPSDGRSTHPAPLDSATVREVSAADAPQVAGPEMDGPAPELDPYRLTGGNPLLLTALVRDQRGFAQPRPEGYGLALLSCLHRGEPVAVQVARALAVLESAPDGTAPDEPAEPASLAGMIGADAAAVARALDAIGAAGLLDSGRFRHPVAHAVVLDDLTASERIDLHRRAARLRHQQGAPAAVVAMHLVAGDDVRPPWATGVLVEAAEQALLDGRPERAATCLRLAVRCAVGGRERAAIRARLAHAEWQTSPAVAARHLSPLLAAAHAGLLDRRTSAALVRQLLWTGRSAEAEELLDRLRAAAAAQPGEDTAEVHDLEIWLATVHPPLARRRGPVPGGAVPATPAADSWLRSVALLADAVAAGGYRASRDAGPAAAGTLAGHGHSRGQGLGQNHGLAYGQGLVQGQGRRSAAGPAGPERAEIILRDLHLARADPWAAEAALLSLLLLTRSPRMEAAVAWCERFLADPGLEDQTARALVTAVRGSLALEQGDLEPAAAYARAALRQLPAKAWGVAIGLPLGTLVLAATRSGELEEAARHLVQSVPEEMLASRYGLDYLHARGHYHLAAGHAHAALADFLACGDLVRGWGLDATALVPWRVGAAEAWLRLGNVDQARQLAQEQLGRSGATWARGPALRLLAAASAPGRRLQPLTEALELLEASGDRFGQARVLADLSRVHDHLDQRRRARLLLRRALHIATMCGARPLAQELLAISGEGRPVTAVGADQEVITGLTDSERRVASLAVMGYTNREIALRLYVTPSTVEQHLTRVYRKLNVKRRQDLPIDLWTDVTRTG